MTDILLVFEVHQPFRVRKDFYWNGRIQKRIARGELFNHYFDGEKDREIFNRISRKCYLPANSIILDAIDESRRGSKQFKCSYSISGTFLEQCERFNPDVLESFKQLASTGRVEFLEQTYYHSLSGLYRDRTEFAEQIQAHRQTMKDLFNHEPRIIENTELLYNNAIARFVERLGYDAMFTEGADRVLGGRSADHVYSAKDCERLKVLLRNYRLTDDIGFRFSARWWNEFPLTAEKFASWLSKMPGDCISLFPDYETFGEHHWPETGIHDFLRHLPREILKHERLSTATPSEVINRYPSAGTIDIPELGGTVSWADIERDTGGWLGNAMQWACYDLIRKIEPMVKETDDHELLTIWRYFQTSDHLYYMFTSGGGPGAVHSYFSPHNTPVDAFVTFHGAILDYYGRVRENCMAANEPFKFHTGVGDESYTGVSVWSLKGFIEALKKVPEESLSFHNSRGDFEQWAKSSMLDKVLASKLAKIRRSKVKGRQLRNMLTGALRARLAHAAEA